MRIILAIIICLWLLDRYIVATREPDAIRCDGGDESEAEEDPELQSRLRALQAEQVIDDFLKKILE
jgi:hypothetical protein